MPQITTQKLVLIVLIAAIGATAASMTQAARRGSSGDQLLAVNVSSIKRCTRGAPGRKLIREDKGIPKYRNALRQDRL